MQRLRIFHFVRPRFSLRMVFLVLTVCGVWMDSQIGIVRERQALLEMPGLVHCGSGGKPLPFVWSLLGAKPLPFIMVDENTPDDIYRRFETAFPEATVCRSRMADSR